MIINDERDILQQNQEDHEDLKKIMSLYGYTEYKTPFIKTVEYKKLVDTFINSDIERKYNFHLSPMKIKNIRKKANQVIIDETEKIDRKVGYIPGDYRLIYDYIAQTGDTNIQNGYRFAIT